MNDDSRVFKKELITPERAKQLLDTNKTNRPVKENRVIFYAEQMLKGKWKEGTGEAIKVDSNGCTIDGQHRLKAVIKSGVSINFDVLYGVDSKVFTVLDTGAVRSPGDVLFVGGANNAVQVASLVGKYLQFKKKSFHSENKIYRPANNEILAEYQKDPAYWKEMTAKTFTWYRNFSKILSPTFIGGWYLMFRESDAAKADSFFDELCSGVTSYSPIINLRKSLTEDKLSSKKFSSFVKAALLVKVWNAYKKEKNVQKISFNIKTEGFPEIL